MGEALPTPDATRASIPAGLSRCENLRVAGDATDHVRAGDQSQDREDARPDDPANAARGRRRDHRMKKPLAAGYRPQLCIGTFALAPDPLPRVRFRITPGPSRPAPREGSGAK